MNPGATMRPRASMVRVATSRRAPGAPTKTMRSPRMAMSAPLAALPVPSMRAVPDQDIDRVLRVGREGQGRESTDNSRTRARAVII
jgi:hypothetical protein